ncbi:MAG: response regulator [Deltaproteobacteria bacterium]|nr:response regulator [Deltaproteobacteria bacterium]
MSSTPLPTAPASALVFVVDDEQGNLDLVARTLRATCQTRTFVESRSMLEAAEKDAPDLVLVDFRMPNTTGVEVLRALRQKGINCPALLVTGFPDMEEVKRARDEGLIFRVITKPWSPPALVANVTLALSLARLDKTMETIGKAER